MVEYADFYTLVATLAPVFFFAGLVGHIRLTADDAEAPERWLVAVFFVLNVVATGLVVGISLFTLAGITPGTPNDRNFQIVALGLQFVIGVCLAVADARRRR